MSGTDLAAQVRDLLAIRDSARRRQLFRPDRAIEADARFVAAVVAAAEEHAAVAAPATRAKPGTAQGARKAPGGAEPKVQA